MRINNRSFIGCLVFALLTSCTTNPQVESIPAPTLTSLPLTTTTPPESSSNQTRIPMDFTYDSENERYSLHLDDPANDMGIDFLDVVEANYFIKGTILEVELTLLDVPEMITFNQANVCDDCLEYSWGVNINVDNDINTGGKVWIEDLSLSGWDYSLEVSSFKKQGSEEIDQPIIDGVSGNVWKSDIDDSMTMINDAFVEIDTEMDKIIFSGSVPGISENSEIIFVTYAYNPGGYVLNDFPDIIQPGKVPQPEGELTKSKTPTEISPKTTPTSTFTSFPASSPTVSPTIAPTSLTNCDVNLLLEQVKSVLTYEESSILYSRVDQRILVVWFVDPELILDPADTAVGEENVLASTIHAVLVSQKLKTESSCVNELVDAIQPVVVDANYNTWYSGEFSLGILPDQPILDASEIADLGNALYIREDLPSEIPSPPTGSCTWQKAHDNIFNHFAQNRLNIGFYFVSDNLGRNAWAQWDSIPGEDALIYAALLNVAMEIRCLHPRPENLIFTAVDEGGELIISGILPYSGIETLDLDQVVIIREGE